MNFKTEVLVSIIIILILVGLIYKLEIDSKQYHCEECVVKFKHQRVEFANEDIIYKLNMSAIELHEGFIEDKCPIIWDRVNGFMKNG